MTTALIVIGVIAFLAVDVYIVYRVIRALRAADDYGATSVPGEMVLSLSKGKLKLTYQEGYKAPSTPDEGPRFSLPNGLEVEVISPWGEPLEIERPGFKGMGSTVTTLPGRSRALIGTVAITQAGEYTVRAGPGREEAVEPQVLAGK